jgi:hypothetical protein
MLTTTVIAAPSKICFKCGEIKQLSEFYKHGKMSDGHVNKCKVCNKADVKENRQARESYYHAEIHRKHDRESDVELLTATVKGSRYD